MSAASRYFDTVGRVNVAMNDTTATDNMIPLLIVLALVVVFYHYLAAGKKTEEKASEVDELKAELRQARHLIAILRNGDYVAAGDVPAETPHPDTVFRATPATGAVSAAPVAVGATASLTAAIVASAGPAATSPFIQDADQSVVERQAFVSESASDDGQLSEEEAAIAALDAHMQGA